MAKRENIFCSVDKYEQPLALILEFRQEYAFSTWDVSFCSAKTNGKINKIKTKKLIITFFFINELVI